MSHSNRGSTIGVMVIAGGLFLENSNFKPQLAGQRMLLPCCTEHQGCWHVLSRIMQEERNRCLNQ